MKIRWGWVILGIAAVALFWRAIPRGHETASAAMLLEPTAGPTEIPTPWPARHTLPSRPKGRKHKAKAEAVAIETPAPAPIATPTALPENLAVTPVPKKSPQVREAQGVLEGVAFKNEEEVLANLGEPDEKLEHDDRVSWYYSKPARNRNGKPVCPEVQFIDEEARMVVMWPPEKMKEKITTARRMKAEGTASSKSPQTFTFLDSFKYLGVGTPDYTVLEDLGEPDSKTLIDGREEWNYDTLIVENGASRRLTVVMQKGKVTEVRGR